MYVVRLLPAGRQLQNVRGEGKARDPLRFGNSKPCLRCLHALAAVGVHRVIFTSGERVPSSFIPGEQCIPCDVRSVDDLLMDAVVEGHSSRGDVQIADASQAPGCHVSAAQAAAASKLCAGKQTPLRKSPRDAGKDDAVKDGNKLTAPACGRREKYRGDAQERARPRAFGQGRSDVFQEGQVG
ncbi:hypothetical protein AB1Y20_013311 [Prymnesium parvum]|uniref:Uncharacterized protein n=1 Tax=Prymnesium parvum TaxID=97485 RepID=A0AB34IKB2_PRYPA